MLNLIQGMHFRDTPDDRPTAAMLVKYLRVGLANSTKEPTSLFDVLDSTWRRCVATSMQSFAIYFACMGSMRPSWYITSMGMHDEDPIRFLS